MKTKMPRPKIGPKSQRLAEKRLHRLLFQLDEQPMLDTIERTIPEAWATLEEDIECQEAKKKITLRLDASVVKFYRAMGPGYQTQINRVLATYAQMKIANVRWFEGEWIDAMRQTRNEAYGHDRGGDGSDDSDTPQFLKD